MPEGSQVGILKVCFQLVVFSQAKEGLTIHVFFPRRSRSGKYPLMDSSVECKCCMTSPANGHFVGKAGACAGSWLLCLELRGYSPHSTVVRGSAD